MYVNIINYESFTFRVIFKFIVIHLSLFWDLWRLDFIVKLNLSSEIIFFLKEILKDFASKPFIYLNLFFLKYVIACCKLVENVLYN